MESSESSPNPPLGRRGTFAANISWNAVDFAVKLGLGLWFTPYLISELGVALFGLIPLATAMSSYMGVVTDAFNRSVARFLTIALEKLEINNANRIFNSSLFGSLGLFIVLLLPSALLSIFADRIVQVPDGFESHARLLFAFACAAFLLNTLATPFSVSAFCRNRLEIRSIINIIFTIARIGLVVVIFRIYDPSIWQVGLALVLATVFVLLGSIWSWRQLTPMLRVDPGIVDKPTLAKLSKTGGWVVLTKLGAILLLSIDLVVVNRVLGAEAAGRYALVLQWAAILRLVGSTLSGVFAPNTIAFYARDDNAGMTNYVLRGIKFVGLTLALPIGAICGLASPLIYAWLGADFVSLAPLLVLLIAPLAANLAVSPILPVLLSANAVRVPALVTVGLGTCNVLLAILLAGPAGWGLYGVATASALAFSAKNIFFVPIYAGRKIGCSPLAIYSRVIPVICGTAVVFAGGHLLASVFVIDSWFEIAAAGAALTAAYGVLAVFVLINQEERKLVYEAIRAKSPF